jgi:hypothetical protein
VLRTENGRNIEILPSFLSIFMGGVRSSGVQEFRSSGVQESGVRSSGVRSQKEERIKLPNDQSPITNLLKWLIYSSNYT